MKRFILLADPRTGSTYLTILLKKHPAIFMNHGIFDDEEPDPTKNYLDIIEKEFSEGHTNYVGIKLFPGEISERNLRFDDICRHNDINYVIVLWRKSIAAQLVSKKIAEKTGAWYEGSDKKDIKNSQTSLSIEPGELKDYYSVLTDDWQQIGTHWPSNLKPIYLCFEDLVAKPIEEIRRVLNLMSVTVALHHYSDLAPGKKLVPVWERISNWNELSPELQSLEIDVKTLLSKEIEKNIDLDQNAC